MDYPNHIVGMIVAMALIGTAALPSAQTHPPSQEPKRGSSVTITSCVEKAQNNGGKFVLTHVAAIPTQPAQHARLVYWVDDVTKIRAHIGHQIRLAGTIVDVTKSEMEVKLGEDDKGGAIIEVEGDGTEVKTSPEKAHVSTRDQKSREREIATTVVKLRVDRVDLVAESCTLGGSGW